MKKFLIILLALSRISLAQENNFTSPDYFKEVYGESAMNEDAKKAEEAAAKKAADEAAAKKKAEEAAAAKKAADDAAAKKAADEAAAKKAADEAAAKKVAEEAAAKKAADEAAAKKVAEEAAAKKAVEEAAAAKKAADEAAAKKAADEAAAKKAAEEAAAKKAADEAAAKKAADEAAAKKKAADEAAAKKAADEAAAKKAADEAAAKKKAEEAAAAKKVADEAAAKKAADEAAAKKKAEEAAAKKAADEAAAKKTAEEAAAKKAADEAAAKKAADEAAAKKAADDAAAKKAADEAAAKKAAEEKPAKVEEAIKIEMVLVKGGYFTMGCTSEQGSDCNHDERPAHNVRLNNFYIAKYPVTQKLWEKVMGTNPSAFFGQDLPVESVSWEEAQLFIKKLNALTGKKYRLLTEAEWEYAARGGIKSKRQKHSGGNNLGKVAWYNANSEQKTHPVGTKQPNELGIYDMNGNVWEWVQDWKDGFDYSSKTSPTGPASGFNRVYRGCGWQDDALYCRVSRRGGSPPDYRGPYLGFRLALPP